EGSFDELSRRGGGQDHFEPGMVLAPCPGGLHLSNAGIVQSAEGFEVVVLLVEHRSMAKPRRQPSVSGLRSIEGQMQAIVPMHQWPAATVGTTSKPMHAGKGECFQIRDA